MTSSRGLLASLAGFALVALALAACSPKPDAAGKRSDAIRFSVLSTDPSQKNPLYFRAFLADMQAQTGLKVEALYSTDPNFVFETMRLKKADAGWFSSPTGLEAVQRANGEVFARAVGANAADRYTSVLIVNAKSPLSLKKVLKCRRNLSFGMGDALSTSGTLAPMTYLFAPRAIDPKSCFKRLHSAGQAANLIAVANGQLDVATNSSASLLLNRQNGRREADEVKVIWRSPVLPGDPIVWRKDLDPSIKEKLRQFFLTYAQGDSAESVKQRGYLAKIDVGGFKPADDTHLLPMREMEATERLIESQRSGNSDRIVRARAALDAITAERVALEGRTRAPAAAQ